MSEKVTIHSRRVIQTSAGPGLVKPMVSVTYSAEHMMPRSIYLDLGKDGPEELRRAIAEDLRRARQAVPETLDLP
jgi:hypothetical protein